MTCGDRAGRGDFGGSLADNTGMPTRLTAGRLRFGAAALISAFLVLLFGTRAPAADLTPSSWTLSHFNPEMNPVVPGPADRISWTFAMGAGTSATPSVVDGIVYLASNDNHVYALDLRTGKLVWKYLTGDDVMTAVLVYHGVAIAGQGNADPQLWDPPYDASIGSTINADYGLDAKTGKELWYMGLVGTGMPTGAIVDKMYIRHDGAGFLTARDARTGNYRWREYLGPNAEMTAVNVVNQYEVVTSGSEPDGVIAVRPQDGKVLWKRIYPLSTNAMGDCPVATDGRSIYGMYLSPPGGQVISTNGQQSQHIYALNAATGATIWDHVVETGVAPERNQSAIPMLHNGVIYDGSSVSPYFHAVDARTGKLLWRVKASGIVEGGSVLKDGVIYFGDFSGKLWAVDAKSGNVLGTKKFADKFRVGSPIIVGNTLIIGGNKGGIFAVPLDDVRSGHDA